jgi:FkbM family methyltransferase
VPALELVLVSILASAGTFVLTRDHYTILLRQHTRFSQPAFEELGPLIAAYGTPRYSRDAEEVIVRDFYKDRRGGIFLDVGANHFRNESNTYYLEQVLGWSGIAVDALPEFGPDYERYRPRTQFVAAFVSDVPDTTATLFVPMQNTLVASSDQAFTVKARSPGDPRQVSATTIDSILDQAGVSRLDFMSMDIELSEPKALAGFTIDRFTPSLVCIEAHPEVRQQVLDYFAAHDYIVVGKYLRMDPSNLYFRPRAWRD